ncbi:hypothetical protein B0H13DRAFT_2272766 [Mycena leptocephala]|nr:hypothetical protein B0H13DRAFT_2272766 [Mycena leptocephala]
MSETTPSGQPIRGRTLKWDSKVSVLELGKVLSSPFLRGKRALCRALSLTGYFRPKTTVDIPGSGSIPNAFTGPMKTARRSCGNAGTPPAHHAASGRQPLARRPPHLGVRVQHKYVRKADQSRPAAKLFPTAAFAGERNMAFCTPTPISSSGRPLRAVEGVLVVRRVFGPTIRPSSIDSGTGVQRRRLSWSGSVLDGSQWYKEEATITRISSQTTRTARVPLKDEADSCNNTDISETRREDYGCYKERDQEVEFGQSASGISESSSGQRRRMSCAAKSFVLDNSTLRAARDQTGASRAEHPIVGHFPQHFALFREEFRPA